MIQPLKLVAFLFTLFLLFNVNVRAEDTNRVSQWEPLMNSGQHQLLVKTIEKNSILHLTIDEQLLYLRALASIDSRLEEADDKVSDAIDEYPDDSRFYLLAAKIKFALAGQASIFSAPGLAKKGLKLLEKGNKISPNQSQILTFLTGFYNSAPSFVGGDKARAFELAKQWQQDDPLRAGVMLVNIYQATDEKTQADTLLTSLEREYPNSHLLHTTLASRAIEQEDMEQAAQHYLIASESVEQPIKVLSYQYELGKLASEHQLSDALMNAGQHGLQAFIEFYKNADGLKLPWAKLHLSNLLFLQDDKATARSLYEQLDALKIKNKAFKKSLKKLKILVSAS